MRVLWVRVCVCVVGTTECLCCEFECVCVDTNMCVRVYVNTSVYVCVLDTSTCVHVWTYVVRIRASVCASVCTYVYMCATYVCVYGHTCVSCAHVFDTCICPYV